MLVLGFLFVFISSSLEGLYVLWAEALYDLGLIFRYGGLILLGCVGERYPFRLDFGMLPRLSSNLLGSFFSSLQPPQKLELQWPPPCPTRDLCLCIFVSASFSVLTHCQLITLLRRELPFSCFWGVVFHSFIYLTF